MRIKKLKIKLNEHQYSEPIPIGADAADIDIDGEDLETTITEIKSDIKDMLDNVYPVGSIYLSVNNVNPSNLFGGTWERFSSGRVLVGVAEGEEEFQTVEKTGGQKNVTLTTTQMPSHTHTFTGTAHNHTVSITSGNQSANHTHSVGAHSHGLNSHTHTYSKSNATTGGHTLTSSEIPSHKHNIEGLSIYTNLKAPNFLYMQSDGNMVVYQKGSSSSTPKWGSASEGSSGTLCYPWTLGESGHQTDTSSTGSGGSHTHSISTTSTNSGAASGSTANSTAFNTGSNSANHTHSVSGSTGNATQGGTNSSTGGGGAHNNLQPYVTCYIWKRVA